MAWEIEGVFHTGGTGVKKNHFLVCFAVIIILLKPVVRERGIYEGEKGVW